MRQFLSRLKRRESSRRELMNKFTLGILAAMLCCAWAAGCSTSSEAGGATASTAATEQEIVPQHGGEMFIAMPANVTDLDPLDASSEDLVNFYSLIYETPLKYDQTGRLRNSLVDSWSVSEDKTVYSFRIRDDVYFSDGTPLTANDVYASAMRAWQSAGDAQDPYLQNETEQGDDAAETQTGPETPMPSSGTYTSRFAEYSKDITGIRLDGDTVVVEVDRPANNVLCFMTFPVTKNGDASHAPGTGPYAIFGDSSTAEGQIVLEANPSWWGGTPNIERIVAVPIEAQRDKIQMQQTSLVDFVTTDALNAGNYALKGQTKVIDYMTNYLDCLVPNITVPGLSNAEVRRAISEAIDRRELLSTVLLNHGVPSNLPIAPDSFIMDDRFRSNQRDTAAALQLLGQAGYRTEESGDGRTLSLTLIVPDVIGSAYKKEAARAISKQLADVFIDVTVVELEESEFWTRLTSGDYDLAYCSYYLSTTPNLSFMVQQNGSANFNGFSDTQIDLALAECAEALTEEQCIEAYSKLQELLNVHMPVIGLYFRMHSIVCDEGIGGIPAIRQETIYDDIANWYTVYTTRPAASPSLSSTVSSEQNRQTEPEPGGEAGSES